MKKVFAVVEHYDYDLQYPEDKKKYTKIIGIANNLPDAYKIIENRKISVGYDDDYSDTYISDCYNWIIEEYDLIGS